MRYLEVTVSRGDVDVCETTKEMWDTFSDRNNFDEINDATIGEMLGEFWFKGTVEHNGVTYNYISVGEEGYLLEVPVDFNLNLVEEISFSENWTYLEK